MRETEAATRHQPMGEPGCTPIRKLNPGPVIIACPFTPFAGRQPSPGIRGQFGHHGRDGNRSSLSPSCIGPGNRQHIPVTMCFQPAPPLITAIHRIGNHPLRWHLRARASIGWASSGWASKGMVAGMPAAGQRGRSRVHSSGKYNSRSIKARVFEAMVDDWRMRRRLAAGHAADPRAVIQS